MDAIGDNTDHLTGECFGSPFVLLRWITIVYDCWNEIMNGFDIVFSQCVGKTDVFG